MTIESASTFLTCSILVMLAVTVIVCASVFINNIIHKYWKSFGWKFFPAYVHVDEVKKD
jgi:hypothetical protein